MGHAVYSLSDPREQVFKGFVEQLAADKGRDEDMKLYNNIERLAPILIAKERKISLMQYFMERQKEYAQENNKDIAYYEDMFKDIHKGNESDQPRQVKKGADPASDHQKPSSRCNHILICIKVVQRINIRQSIRKFEYVND